MQMSGRSTADHFFLTVCGLAHSALVTIVIHYCHTGDCGFAILPSLQDSLAHTGVPYKRAQFNQIWDPVHQILGHVCRQY
jgi:hypothetical protein